VETIDVEIEIDAADRLFEIDVLTERSRGKRNASAKEVFPKALVLSSNSVSYPCRDRNT